MEKDIGRIFRGKVMSKILITGGAGFIGYFITKKLSENKNNSITIIDNLSRCKIDTEFKELLENRNIQFIQGDLTDQRSLAQLNKDYEYIYHLAAIVGVKNVAKKPEKTLYINAISTLNIFEYIKMLKNVKKVFLSSTSEVYAGTLKHFSIKIPTSENVPLTIDDISSERTTYALSKIYTESSAFVYSKKYHIPVIIGRFHNVYGPRMGFAHVIPEMFIKIKKSREIDVPSANHTRAFCYIDDAVEFTIRACENNKAINEIFNIGNSREEIQIRELVLLIADIMGKNITIHELPMTQGSPPRRCPDTSKIEKLTNYIPVVSLKTGILKTYEWYKDKLDNPFE